MKNFEKSQISTEELQAIKGGINAKRCEELGGYVDTIGGVDHCIFSM